MKNRKLFISILTGLCACLMSATLLTACKDDHTHSYTEQTVKATCTEKGLMTYTCDCGDVHTEDLPALGHDYVPHEAQAPTCTEIGWNAYNTCSRCNYTEYEEINALTHDEKTHEAKNPTCTEKGWNEYVTCERDGCDYSTYEEIPATGNHTWNNGEITTEPTCTEKGVKTFTCTVCQNATYTEDVPALDHDKVQHNAQAATCTEKGWNAYETCSRCDYTTYVEIPALNHDKVQHNAQSATCTEKGWNAYETCTRCGYTTYVEIPALDHDREQHNAQAATCTEKGWNAYETCSRCDYTTYVELPALDHDKVQHNAQSATCTEKGWNAYETCSRCDYTTYVELPALNHDKVQHGAQSATCTEKGWNAYETCSRCSYTTYVELPALTHDKVQYNAQAATCTEKGWNAYETCSRCDYTTYVEIPATGIHIWDNGKNTTEPTCTEKGIKTFTCTTCTTANYTEDVPATGHSEVEHPEEPATCQKSGFTAYVTCSNCSYATEKTVIPVQSHSFKYYISDGNATCVKSGTKTALCEYGCGERDVAEESAGTHYPVFDEDIVKPTSTSVGYYEYWVFCKYCEMDLAHDIITLSGSGSSSGASDSDRWRSNPLLAAVPYPTGATVQTLELDNMNTQLGDYYGWAGGYFTASKSVIDNYLAQVSASAYTYNVQKTYGSYVGYNASGTRMLSVGFVGNKLTILLYKVKNENTSTGTDDHICKFSVAVYESPTCTQQGYEVFYCVYGCGKSYLERSHAWGHLLLETVEGYAPTCTNTGLTDGVFCWECETTVVKQTEIPALGHNDVDGLCSRCEIPIEYKIDFIVDGEIYTTLPFNVNTMNSLIIPVVPDKKGHTGVWADFEMKKESFAVEAIYTPITYTISYELNGGTNHASNPTEYVFGTSHTLYTPKIDEELVIFGGWFTDNTFTAASAVSQISSNMAGNITLYAQWLRYRVEEAEGFHINYYGAMPELSSKVSNATERFDFKGKITVSEGCTWKVYGDEYSSVSYDLKVVPLNTGNNTYYIVVFHPDGEYYTQYVVKIYRRKMYTVSFDTKGGTEVENQIVEEDSFATIPETTRLGYTFDSWDYDFTKPIWYDRVIKANWKANDDTKYTVKYYIQNLKNEQYTLYESVERKGTTDTLATAEIKEYKHFTYNEQASLATVSGNIDPDGSRVLSVYYMRNSYSIVVENYVDSNCVNDGSYDSVIYCDVCQDELLRETVVIPAKGHDYIHHEAKEETCTEVGWNEYNTCSRCDYTDYIEIPALDHDYIYHAGQAVTCLEIGWNEYHTCSRCDYNEYEEIPALDHDYISHEAQAETCTEVGWEEYDTCSRCDYTTYVEIPVLGHDYISHEAKEAICTVGWSAYETCSRCDYSTYQEIKATDAHNVENGYCIYCNRQESTQGLAYSLNSDGTYTVTGIGDCTATEIVIDLYNNRSITEIKYYAFDDCDSLTSVTIGNSVTSIGNQAFYNCSRLTSITIPDSVTSIGSSAFYDCDSLTSVTIGNSVTSIGSSAFYDCDSLTSVTIGNSVTSIGSFAFAYCSSLTSVTIPDSVTSIGSSAFYDCDSLTSVIIPDSVTSIGNYAFEDCSSLTSITIPDSVTSIGYSAFYDCDSLTRVYITDIAAWCNISFDNSLANPLRYAKNLYLNNELVKELIIPDGVTSIGEYAFYDCDSLTSITIPDSVTSIGSDAFYYCKNLTSVYISDMAEWCNITFKDYDTNPLRYAKNLYLNNELVTELIIPDSVTSIGEYTFDDCDSLTSVTIGNSVTSIGHSAFSSCSSLTSVTIGNSVTSIGSSAFSVCSSLTSVIIPDSVTSIGREAFYNCSSLTSVYYKGTTSDWSKISISPFNSKLTNAMRYYYSETKPTSSGKYWHYDENGDIAIW